MERLRANPPMGSPTSSRRPSEQPNRLCVVDASATRQRSNSQPNVRAGLANINEQLCAAMLGVVLNKKEQQQQKQAVSSGELVRAREKNQRKRKMQLLHGRMRGRLPPCSWALRCCASSAYFITESWKCSCCVHERALARKCEKARYQMVEREKRELHCGRES